MSGPTGTGGNGQPAKEVSDADLIYWESCQSRVASYLTTNGQIAISVCGLYATTISVLVTVGLSGDREPPAAIFSLVIPAFSVVLMTIGIRVYVWIKEQLEYSALAGLHPEKHAILLSFEEWRTECCREWSAMSLRKRFWLSLAEGLRVYLSFPFRFRDVYMYYFFIYSVTPALAAAYATTIGEPWWIPFVWIPANFAFFAAGYAELLRYEIARERVTEMMIGRYVPPKRYNLQG